MLYLGREGTACWGTDPSLWNTPRPSVPSSIYLTFKGERPGACPERHRSGPLSSRCLVFSPPWTLILYFGPLPTSWLGASPASWLRRGEVGSTEERASHSALRVSVTFTLHFLVPRPPPPHTAYLLAFCKEPPVPLTLGQYHTCCHHPRFTASQGPPPFLLLVLQAEPRLRPNGTFQKTINFPTLTNALGRKGAAYGL